MRSIKWIIFEVIVLVFLLIWLWPEWSDVEGNVEIPQKGLAELDSSIPTLEMGIFQYSPEWLDDDEARKPLTKDEQIELMVEIGIVIILAGWAVVATWLVFVLRDRLKDRAKSAEGQEPLRVRPLKTVPMTIRMELGGSWMQLSAVRLAYPKKLVICVATEHRAWAWDRMKENPGVVRYWMSEEEDNTGNESRFYAEVSERIGSEDWDSLFALPGKLVEMIQEGDGNENAGV